MNLEFFILFFIYILCIFPVIIIYLDHGTHEIETSYESTGKSAIRTFAEGGFLIGSAIAYIISIFAILIRHRHPLPYLVVIIGTIIIFYVYLARMVGGVQIPFTDVIIQKYTVGEEGLLTKMLQLISIVPISMLLRDAIYHYRIIRKHSYKKIS